MLSPRTKEYNGKQVNSLKMKGKRELRRMVEKQKQRENYKEQ
jgi:hypothetical protein